MDQYPDENEEYELLYQDELEMLNEVPPNENENYVPVNQTQQQQQQQQQSQQTTKLSLADESSITNSPHYSQINPVNRRLFGSQCEKPVRGCSTPLAAQPQAKKKLPLDLPPTVEEPVFTELQNFGKRSKRRLERDLFGDIDDLYGYDTSEDPAAKKLRTEEEKAQEDIEKILEARRRYNDVHQIERNSNLNRLKALHDFKMRNLSYTVPNWPFLKIVRNDGQTVYTRFHSKDYEDREINEIQLMRDYSSLLGESKAQIWAAANEIVLQRMTATQSNNALEMPNQQLQPGKDTERLWVEKYKPMKYIDLLSDEMTNRSLLYWLKMWDKVVFGRALKVKTGENTSNLNTFNKRTGKFESNGGWRNRKVKGQLDTNLDELDRPMQKVALLCGPPGLGKTTLAHTIARHAGYSVREINASDDRSVAAFKMALENGTQMSSVLNADKRPNCIILDEIDGAPKQSIEFLVKFVSDDYTSGVRSKGAKAKKNILKRPIICICNDIYDPALRPLRQIAFLVTFPPIDSARLAERLEQIARRERLKTDFGALIALAEKSGNDVRSCISSMQFFNAQKKELRLGDVLNNNLGQKDRHQGLFDVWTAVFRIERPKKILDTGNNDADGGPEVVLSKMSIANRAKNVLDVVHAGGDYERLTQGVFENYLSQKMPDSKLNGVVEATQWFVYTDCLNHHINEKQNYSVYPYLQYGFVTWHLLFATLAFPKITFPMRGYEFTKKMTAQKHTLEALRKGIRSNAIGIGQGAVLLIETVPYLKHILSPQMRSLDVQLFSQRERAELRHCIEIMIDLGITYKQVKNMEGHYQFVIDPDVESLVQFPGSQGIKLTSFARQLMAREIELELIRRITKKLSENKPATAKQSKPNHLQTLQPKRIDQKKQKETVTKDFFGNIQRTDSEALQKEEKVDPIVKSPIWYHYKEGFNNAVRKDIHLHELL